MSDYLPPPLVEESRMQEMVRNAMKNTGSKAYRHLVNACLSQPVTRAKDIFFDGDTPKGGTVGMRRIGLAHIELRRAVEAVFQRHGAVPVESAHLLLPATAACPWRRDMETPVKLMTRSGDVVLLPHDLRVPFARLLARLPVSGSGASSNLNFKRYTIGRVVKEKKVFGLHPKELSECAFDIVSGPEGRVLADAELLLVCQEVVQAVLVGGGPGEVGGDTRFFLRLGHGKLLHGLLLHSLVPEAVHDRVVEAIRVGWAKPVQLAGRLQSLGLTDTTIGGLMPLLSAEAGLSQLTSLLRGLTRRRGEAAELVKAGLSELKAIEATAVRLGLVLELQYSVRSLYPPSQYSGLTLQLIRVMPGRRNNASRLVDIVAAGGRYDILVQRQEARLLCTVIEKWWCYLKGTVSPV